MALDEDVYPICENYGECTPFEDDPNEVTTWCKHCGSEMTWVQKQYRWRNSWDLQTEELDRKYKREEKKIEGNNGR